jgi:hypothetical protein
MSAIEEALRQNALRSEENRKSDYEHIVELQKRSVDATALRMAEVQKSIVDSVGNQDTGAQGAWKRRIAHRATLREILRQKP